MKDPLASVENLTEMVTEYIKRPRERETVPDPPTTPPTDNLALDRCCRAYEAAWATAKERGAGRNAVELEADAAFRRAMPTLAGRESIPDFIACVAHGVLIDAISAPNAARLLYAAQVAGTSAKFAPAQKYPYIIPPNILQHIAADPDSPSSKTLLAYFSPPASRQGSTSAR